MLICLDGQRPWSVAYRWTCFKNQNPYRDITLSALFAIVFLACIGANAQSSLKTAEIAVPVQSGIVGVSEAPALTEILDHLKVVGASPWTGMQGSGTITYGSDDTPHKATLTIQGSSRFRLDWQTSTGPVSIRISGRYGKIQEANGKVFPLPPDTAATGIFQFELPHLANFPEPNSSLIDHGISVSRGQTLHRLSYECSIGRSKVEAEKSGTEKPRTVVTDLYFDPQTHLLARSVNNIQIDGAGSNKFLREITYEDYRKVDGALIPFRFTQVLNGQRQWTLQLSEVHFNISAESTYFQF